MKLMKCAEISEVFLAFTPAPAVSYGYWLNPTHRNDRYRPIDLNSPASIVSDSRDF